MTSEFITLPTEIHISLLALVDILDVISLRQTCKSLYAQTNERIIWLNMLRKVCAKHHLFYPELSMQAMTTRELEDAACGPSKWLSVASKTAEVGCTLTPRHTQRIPLLDRHIPTPFVGPPKNRQHFQVHSWYLVPGGKYLVTWSSTALSVWDLKSDYGYTSCQPLSAVSIPVWEEAAYRLGTTMVVLPTANGNGLTIMTFFHRQQVSESSPEWFICKIYDIWMDDSAPTLHCIASLEGPRHKKGIPCAIHGDLLMIFFQPGEVAVWNFRTDAWANWFVAGSSFFDVGDSNAKLSVQILIQSNYVALLRHDEITVWPIPPLANVNNQSARFQPHDSTPVAASGACGVPVQPLRRYRWVSPQPWSLGTSSNGSLPVIGTKTHHGLDVINFDSFELVVSEDLSMVSISKRLPTVILDHTMARVQLRAQYSNLACVTIFGRNSLRIHPFAASGPESDVPVHLAKSDVITIPMSPVQDIPDFCPASGRVAFMEDKDYAAIQVWDFC